MDTVSYTHLDVYKRQAQHSILPLSKFGLMQITRERVKPAVLINTNETCPTCGGTGQARPSILVADEIERDIEFIMNNRSDVKLTLEAHPFVVSYFRHGFWNRQMQMWWKYKKWIKIKSNENLALSSYKLLDSNEDEIRSVSYTHLNASCSVSTTRYSSRAACFTIVTVLKLCPLESVK